MHVDMREQVALTSKWQKTRIFDSIIRTICYVLFMWWNMRENWRHDNKSVREMSWRQKRYDESGGLVYIKIGSRPYKNIMEWKDGIAKVRIS